LIKEPTVAAWHSVSGLTDKPTAIGCGIIYVTTSPKQAERSKERVQITMGSRYYPDVDRNGFIAPHTFDLALLQYP